MIKPNITHGIKVNSKINKNKLKPNDYSLSLLKEAVDIGMLNIGEYYDIQRNIINVLKEIILLYTKGESSSVTIETTENLLCSIMYAIDIYSSSFDNPDEALISFRQKSVKDIHEEGINLLHRCYDDTLKTYKKLNKDKLHTKLEAYNTTLQEAIPLFFKKYNMIFGAHNTMASIDYPLAIVVDDIQIRGVSYIKKYLMHLEIETRFCKYFDTKDIERILVNYGRAIKMDYKIELINIFELVINNAVFGVMAGNNATNLIILDYQLEALNSKIEQLSLEYIEKLIDAAFKEVVLTLKITDIEMLTYLDSYKSILVYRFNNAINNNNLSSIIIVEKEQQDKEQVSMFQANNRMSNYEFNTMVNKIMNTYDVKEIIEIIQSSIQSLHDFIDLLNADCLYERDFKEIFAILGNMELAILTRIVFYEKLRGETIQLNILVFEEIEIQEEWKKHFLIFLQELSVEKLKQIEEYLSKINFEEISFY